MKEYTKEDVISILDFAKGKKIKSKTILSNWRKNQNNYIEESDDHGLSVVGIFEHPITNKDNKEIGKIVIFNYKGVGGGWEIDIYDMVEKKYFSTDPYYHFRAGDNNSCFYRFFLIGDDIFDDESFNQWEKPKNTDEFRVFKQKLPNSELIITYDISRNGDGLSTRNKLERNNDYSFYWDDSAFAYYIKNIHNLDYKPSRLIIEERIKNRIDKK